MNGRSKYMSIFWKLALVIAIPVAILLVAGCSPAQETRPSAGSYAVPVNGVTQTSSGGAVDIQVKWETDRKDLLVFEVSMNTHSVDLDKYDLKQLTVLYDSQGNEYKPLSWSSAPGGHHRSGKLSFAVPNTLKEGSTRSLRMVIRNVAGVSERSLKWDLG